MFLIPSFRLSSINLEQFSKALFSIELTLLGITSFWSEEQPEKADSPILTELVLYRLISVSELQPKNAYLSILLILEGNMMCVKSSIPP